MKDEITQMITVAEALDIILSSVSVLGEEEAAFLETAGRVLSRDIESDINVPPLDNSAMDGFALRHEDVTGSSDDSPVELVISDEVRAGINMTRPRVEKGAAVRIMTGAPVPEGATGVVPVEETVEADGRVKIFRPIVKNENIRFAGEDITRGQVVLKKGDTLRSADIGLLASLNRQTVHVTVRPSVGIITTGDEIVDIGGETAPGQIRNSNAYTLINEVKKYGGVPHYLGITKDTIEDTTAMIERALKHDVIITTGGVSMGEYDFVRDVVRELGVDIKIETIKMKPGKPVVFGTLGDKLFFGLPGNPVSTMISFIQFVRPALLGLMGATKIDKPLAQAILENNITKKPGRLNFIRAFHTFHDGALHVNTTGPQGSGILRSMSLSNCLIILPEEVSLVTRGEKVLIQLISHEEV